MEEEISTVPDHEGASRCQAGVHQRLGWKVSGEGGARALEEQGDVVGQQFGGLWGEGNGEELAVAVDLATQEFLCREKSGWVKTRSGFFPILNYFASLFKIFLVLLGMEWGVVQASRLVSHLRCVLSALEGPGHHSVSPNKHMPFIYVGE